MQGHETGLAELGFADTKVARLRVQDHIHKIQSDGFASPETGAGKQAQDGLEGQRQEGAFGLGRSRSVKQCLNLFSREQKGA